MYLFEMGLLFETFLFYYQKLFSNSNEDEEFLLNQIPHQEEISEIENEDFKPKNSSKLLIFWFGELKTFNEIFQLRIERRYFL